MGAKCRGSDNKKGRYRDYTRQMCLLFHYQLITGDYKRYSLAGDTTQPIGKEISPSWELSNLNFWSWFQINWVWQKMGIRIGGFISVPSRVAILEYFRLHFSPFVVLAKSHNPSVMRIPPLTGISTGCSLSRTSPRRGCELGKSLVSGVPDSHPSSVPTGPVSLSKMAGRLDWVSLLWEPHVH